MDITYWCKEIEEKSLTASIVCTQMGYGTYYFDIEITEHGVEFIQEGEYYGPNEYYSEILKYDLCALLALWDEVYGD